MTDGEIVLGSEVKGGLKGQVVDARFYTTAPTLAETQFLFKSKLRRCMGGCQNCESPIRCATCKAGYQMVNGVCQVSQCADYYVFNNKSLNVHQKQVHPVYASQLFTIATITYVTRSGNPRWNADWGNITMEEEREDQEGFNILRARPMRPSDSKTGINVTVSVTGPGTYGVYMSFTWPAISLSDYYSQESAVEQVNLTESIAPIRAHSNYDHMLKDTAIVHAVGSSYELVNAGLIEPDSIISSMLSAQVRERLFTVRLTQRSTLTVSLISCDGQLSLRLTSVSDPGANAEYRLLNETLVGEIRDAVGMYRFTVTGSERKPYNNKFQVAVTSSTSKPRIPDYENLWLNPTSDSSGIHMAWRPIKWEDGSDVTGPVSYLLQIAHTSVGKTNMCNLETVSVNQREVTLDQSSIEGNLNIFAVLPTDLGMVTVPYATAKIHRSEGFSPFFVLLVLIVLSVLPTAFIVFGNTQRNQKLEKQYDDDDESYHLLEGNF